MRGDFTAVVTARNEEATLPMTLIALLRLPNLCRLVVVDDGSLDDTPSLARAAGAEVVTLFPSRGKGGALRAGLLTARPPGSSDSRPAQPMLLADADLGASAAHLLTLLQALDEEHPVSVAAFPKGVAARGGFGLVKELSRRAIARRTGFVSIEPLSGQRALLPRALDALPGIAPGFGAEVGMTLDLLSAGIKPLEVPLPLAHRATGRSPQGFAHRARQGLDVLRALRGDRIPW